MVEAFDPDADRELIGVGAHRPLLDLSTTAARIAVDQETGDDQHGEEDSRDRPNVLPPTVVHRLTILSLDDLQIAFGPLRC